MKAQRERARQEVLNVNTDRSDGTIDREKYEAMKSALLEVIPEGEEGVPFGELAERVKPLLPEAVFEGASIGWYTTTVKLDLEARGLIERVPNASPQRLRRR